MNNFHYAQYLAYKLYGVELPDDEFEEIGLIAYNRIGNKVCRNYRFFGKVDKKTLSLELPCNLLDIISVCGAWEDWEHVTNKHFNGDFESAWIEQYIEKTKMFKDPLYLPGKFLHYEQVGNTLYFDRPYFVGILYKGEQVDDDGLPYLTNKEAEAIAAYVAYTLKFKDYLKNMNKAEAEAAAILKQLWDIKCDQAKTPDYINQNEMDEILDAKVSWNRKRFDRSLKPII